jgi:hypothetical protein
LLKFRTIEDVKTIQSGQRLPTERVNHYVTDGEIALADLTEMPTPMHGQQRRFDATEL